MLSHYRRPAISTLALLLICVALASCRGPVPVWNEDGTTMTDLRTLRHRGKQSVTLTRGVHLYADAIRFSDKRQRVGEATGNVLLYVDPSVRYEWLLKYGYAGRALFDKTQSYVELADQPKLEREFMTQIATEPYTTITVRWDSLMAEVVVKGPTRTDFAKSHPIPPGQVFPQVPLPAEPVRPTLPQRGFHKR